MKLKKKWQWHWHWLALRIVVLGPISLIYGASRAVERGADFIGEWVGGYLPRAYTEYDENP